MVISLTEDQTENERQQELKMADAGTEASPGTILWVTDFTDCKHYAA